MTKYGFTFSQVMRFTIPMILTSLVVTLMFVTDRLVLGRYSINAMTAATIGGNFLAMTAFLGVSIANVATVFVGQYNGSGEYEKIGRPVWQMIYFGLMLFVIFVPASLLCHKWGIFAPAYEYEGLNYIKPLLACMGSLACISTALTAFFVGRGRSVVIIVVFACANIINLFLDIMMVFGIDGWWAPMGAQGAAYATIITEICQVIALFILFLHPRNRDKYRTHDYQFRRNLLLKCMKVGVPLSLTRLITLSSWFTLASIFSYASPDIAAVEAFAVTIWVLFIFFAEGGSRALSSLAANLIGQHNRDGVGHLLSLFLRCNYVLCALLLIPLIWRSDIVLQIIDSINQDFAHLHDEMLFVLYSLWLQLLLDGIYYLFCGVLNAGGDTKFPMVLESTTLVLGVVLPTVIIYHMGLLTTIKYTYTLLPITQIINVVLVYYRYKQQKWYKLLVKEQSNVVL